MSDKQYYPDTDNASGSLEQTGQVGQNASPKNHDAPKSAWGDIPTCGEDPADSLRTVTAGIINGASPLQFMDRINAGSRQLGNRAFLQFVEKLQKGRPAGDFRETTARGLQGPGQPLTHLAALQRAFGHHDIRGMREYTDSAAASALDMLGAFVISGFSMLRPGDEKISQGGLNIASWFLEEDPGKFREGFVSVDLPNLIFLGGIKHPPLNVGAAGAKALALSPEESAQSTNRTKTREFGRSSENSFPYAEAVHRKVLEYFGQTGMTEAGQKWLSPDYQLTDAAKNLVFPDQCPIDITGTRPNSAMNIAEEFQ